MRVVVQRVKQAAVTIAGQQVASIGPGLLLFVGLQEGDHETSVVKLAQKIAKLRIFADAAGKTNLNIKAVAGAVLSVSQFTLLAKTNHGNRQSFTAAMRPETAEPLWQLFNQTLMQAGIEVATGHFGADMQVQLVNDGPFTLVLDAD
ncbi:MAG: D-aminoacyl-tRNA deacylase [Lactobacillus sp.]|nr:D-aminoacyl-tRNA deacylase [Lactobacillus sp.]MDN6053137.1 D-aminoacyl-tRNA deacylase [Lactobacillus sp.]